MTDLVAQPAAAGVSDRVVKALLAQALFFKEGAHTVASLEADIRAILAMRPQSEPVAFAWREKGSAKPWAVASREWRDNRWMSPLMLSVTIARII